MHAHNHLRVLNELNDSGANLDGAWGGENFEITEMYPAYISVAAMQDEKKAKQSFDWAVRAEETHRSFYQEAKDLLGQGKDRGNAPLQVCENCGYTLAGDAPEKCPSCGFPKNQFRQF